MTDVRDTAVGHAFEELRQLIQADGGDMAISSFDGATITIDLLLETANCVECVMPRKFLERVALDILKQSGIAVDTVVVTDPREQPGFIPPAHGAVEFGP